jgi:glutamate dehydrogenase
VAVGSGEAGEGRSLEALVHCEVPHVARPERRDEIRDEVARRLTDVVEATRDFHAMLEALDAATAAVADYAGRPGENAHEYAEYVAFLRWLRDGNFVFLGARAYTVSGGVLQVDAHSGLGILADEESSATPSPPRWPTFRRSCASAWWGGPLLV